MAIINNRLYHVLERLSLAIHSNYPNLPPAKRLLALRMFAHTLVALDVASPSELRACRLEGSERGMTKVDDNQKGTTSDVE